MKFLDIQKVILKYRTTSVSRVESFYFEDSNGKLICHELPAYPQLTEHYRWMSETGCLDQLLHITPTIESNYETVKLLSRIKDYLSENYGLFLFQNLKQQVRETVINSLDDPTEAEKWVDKLSEHNYPPELPETKIKIIWTFKDPKYATMFKLAVVDDGDI